MFTAKALKLPPDIGVPVSNIEVPPIVKSVIVPEPTAVSYTHLTLPTILLV